RHTDANPASKHIMNKKLLSFLFVLFFIASCAVAQDANSALRPPKGSQLALVVFEDLQCPQCRRAAPLVEQAAKTYKIPVVRHDFPLPLHNWSFQAAVMAHYFDSHSKQLGNDFRDYIFQHQLEINPGNLRSFAEKFAADHKVDLPFVFDPQGKLAVDFAGDEKPHVIIARLPKHPFVAFKIVVAAGEMHGYQLAGLYEFDLPSVNFLTKRVDDRSFGIFWLERGHDLAHGSRQVDC